MSPLNEIGGKLLYNTYLTIFSFLLCHVFTIISKLLYFKTPLFKMFAYNSIYILISSFRSFLTENKENTINLNTNRFFRVFNIHHSSQKSINMVNLFISTDLVDESLLMFLKHYKGALSIQIY